MPKTENLSDERQLALAIHSIIYSSDVIGRYFATQVEEHEVIPIELAALAQLFYEKDNMTLTELCVALYRSPNAVSSLIRKMEKAGLVKKETDKKDRRFQTVSLTPRGKELHLRLEPVVGQISRDVLGDLTQEQIKQLDNRLKKIRQKLLDKAQSEPGSVLNYK
jgi:MarR family transcriptional regulator, organic hydroperoxide resistance regulator